MEFKVRVPNKLKELSEEICAFANAAGGVLLIRVRDEMKEAKLQEPEFKTDGMFTVILPRVEEKSSGKSSEPTWSETRESLINKSPVKIGKSALGILEMIYTNQYVTIPDMAKQLGITERGVEKNIQKLKAQNLLACKEGERSGYWEIIIHHS